MTEQPTVSFGPAGHSNVSTSNPKKLNMTVNTRSYGGIIAAKHPEPSLSPEKTTVTDPSTLLAA